MCINYLPQYYRVATAGEHSTKILEYLYIVTVREIRQLKHWINGKMQHESIMRQKASAM